MVAPIIAGALRLGARLLSGKVGKDRAKALAKKRVENRRKKSDKRVAKKKKESNKKRDEVRAEMKKRQEKKQKEKAKSLRSREEVALDFAVKAGATGAALIGGAAAIDRSKNKKKEK
jgi:hypothetical protein